MVLYAKKKIITSLLPGLVFYGMLLLQGCGGSDNPALTEQQKAARAMEEGSPWGGTGNVEVVDVPTGVDPSGLSSLTLVFTTSGEPEWEPAGFEATGADDFLSTSNSTWKWGGTGTEIITLTNASSSELTGVYINGQELTITFEINSGGGTGTRVAGLDGTYTVRLQENSLE